MDRQTIQETGNLAVATKRHIIRSTAKERTLMLNRIATFRFPSAHKLIIGTIAATALYYFFN